MTEHRLMTLHEELQIGVKAAALDDAGRHEEAMALAKTRPISPRVAKAIKEKVSWGRDYLKNSGWNMAEVEAKYGKDWLDR